MTSETREKINRASIFIDNAMYCDDDKSLRVIGRLYYGGKEYGVGITETKEKPDTLEIRTPETCLTYSGGYPICGSRLGGAYVDDIDQAIDELYGLAIGVKETYCTTVQLGMIAKLRYLMQDAFEPYSPHRYVIWSDKILLWDMRPLFNGWCGTARIDILRLNYYYSDGQLVYLNFAGKPLSTAQDSAIPDPIRKCIEGEIKAEIKRKEEKERAEQRRIAAYSQKMAEVESDGDEFDFADVDDPVFWRQFDAIQNNECPEI